MANEEIARFMRSPEVKAVFDELESALTRKVMHANNHEASHDAWLEHKALKKIRDKLNAKGNSDG